MAHTTCEEVFLQSVLIRSEVEFEDAVRWAQFYIRNYKRTYYRLHDGWYEFRNIFKNRFSLLKKKHINTNVVLVYGTLKDDDVQGLRRAERGEALSITEGDGWQSREEVHVQTLSEGVAEADEGGVPGFVLGCFGVRA
jgi:hypothetical protein